MGMLCVKCPDKDRDCRTCNIIENYWSSLPWSVVFRDATKQWISEYFLPVRKGLTFEQALTALKTGKRVTNAKWNGKNQYLFMMPGYKSVQANETLSKAAKISQGSDVVIAPYLMLRNSEGIFSNWVPSNGDLFSNEWEIVDDSIDKLCTSHSNPSTSTTVCPYKSPYQGYGSSTSVVHKFPDGSIVTDTVFKKITGGSSLL